MNDDRETVMRLLTQLDMGLSLRGRCAGGMRGGAWLVADGHGRLAVLKVCHNDLAPRVPVLREVVGRLRSAGYPTPEWLASGLSADGFGYWIADHVPGRASTPLTPGKTRLLLEVLESQAGLDPDPSRNWSEYVLRPDPAHVPGPVVDSYLALFEQAGPVHLPSGDMVHGDFNSCNIFLDSGAVSGVIDIEAIGSGTRAVDYAWLLREAYLENYGPEVIAMIRRAGEAVAGPEALRVCMAATVFDIFRFKLRHQPSQINEVIARLHLLAEDLGRCAS